MKDSRNDSELSQVISCSEKIKLLFWWWCVKMISTYKLSIEKYTGSKIISATEFWLLCLEYTQFKANKINNI